MTVVNPRFVPVLLLRNSALVKTQRFGEATYLGDAVNTAAIFNSKMVDEIAVLDIDAPRRLRGPDFAQLRHIASECFMPLTFGGGIRSLEEIHGTISAGAEKVIITTGFVEVPGLVTEAAKRFGSQSVVVGLDVRRKADGAYETFTSAGTTPTGLDPVTAARRAVDEGAGEIMLQSIDRDGTYSGYDLEMIRQVTSAVPVSVVALGGARNLDDLADAIVVGGASAAAAGSMFVFFGRLRAVLINVPGFGDRASALQRAYERQAN